MCDVLLVDDEDLVRGTLVAILEEDGLTVHDVGNPAQAMEFIHDTPGCRILVTDIDLGAGAYNGFALADGMRHDQPDIPILFISGRPWLLKARVRHPLERALPKPFSIEVFTHLVRQLLELRPEPRFTPSVAPGHLG
ncbi:response regulator [Roseomonas elaeocarpi]|uniref:Response regulator n=1 Tax=Roseomonas elaeocarpi TaxID=907779 RepID=A0ABV6JVV3_9PROT